VGRGRPKADIWVVPRLTVLASVLVALAWAPAGASAHGHADRRIATHGPDPRPARGVAHAHAAAAQPAAPWCGDERVTDVPGATDGLAGFHAVYAVAADAPSRLQQVAPTIQGDAAAASGILEQQYGRAIRFDRGTSCGPGYLDITTLRLPQTTAALQRLAQTPNGTLDAIGRALRKAGFATAQLGDPARARGQRLRNFVVWLDGPYPAASCGQAELSVDRRRSPDNVNNGGGKVAAIFADGAGFCGPSTVLHEIGHTLGAVQPRPGESGWTGHCHDDAADVLCDAAAPPAATGARTVVDAAHDDYWDPPSGAPLPWWTMNLSRFLCPDVACSTAPAAATQARVRTNARSRPRAARR